MVTKILIQQRTVAAPAKATQGPLLVNKQLPFQVVRLHSRLLMQLRIISIIAPQTTATWSLAQHATLWPHVA